MSVDDTIRELSGTLSQLSLLVARINEQMGGISGRINITLQNFDDSVAGIAKDANKMTEQVDTTIAQIPGSWAFYLLFFTFIAVLVLLSIFIVINLVVKIQSICRRINGELSRASTPLQSLVQSDSKEPLQHAPTIPRPFLGHEREPAEVGARLRHHHVTVEMETEPRRFGLMANPLPQHSQSQFIPPTMAKATTIYHPPPGTGLIRQMGHSPTSGNGGWHREGANSTPGSRDQHHERSSSPRSQQGANTVAVHPMFQQHPLPIQKAWSLPQEIESNRAIESNH